MVEKSKICKIHPQSLTFEQRQKECQSWWQNRPFCMCSTRKLHLKYAGLRWSQNQKIFSRMVPLRPSQLAELSRSEFDPELFSPQNFEDSKGKSKKKAWLYVLFCVSCQLVLQICKESETEPKFLPKYFL